MRLWNISTRDCTSCALIFLLRLSSNRLVDIHGYIHMFLSCLFFCMCDRIICNWFEFSGSFDMGASVGGIFDGVGWIFEGVGSCFPELPCILTRKQWMHIHLCFCITIFTAACLGSCHNARHVNFEEAFGTRSVQYWTYKQSKTKLRYIYDNTPSIFDETTVVGTIDDDIRRQQLAKGINSMRFALKQERVVHVRTDHLTIPTFATFVKTLPVLMKIILHQLLASVSRKRRVLLVGDECHLNVNLMCCNDMVSLVRGFATEWIIQEAA